VAALRLASGLKTEAATPEEVSEVDHGLGLAGLYRDNLGSLVLKIMRLVRKTAVLHTLAYFAASEGL